MPPAHAIGTGRAGSPHRTRAERAARSRTLTHSRRAGDLAFVALLWLFATGWNAGKAFHIDDAAYLEIARWIAEEPLHPMSGLLNWDEDLEPIHRTNQPLLYGYLMAGWAQCFGWSETSMHALMALFALWAIAACYRLARLAAPGSARRVALGLVACPAFVVGQNSMVDVPLLAVWTEFFVVLFAPALSDRRRYASAAVLCSLALWIKYTSLVLLPALGLHMAFTGRRKCWAWSLLPLGALAAWSAFNWFDYGGVHIATRSVEARTAGRLLDLAIAWTLTLGAVLPSAIGAFARAAARARQPGGRIAWGIALALGATAPALFCLGGWFRPSEAFVALALKLSFLATGAGIGCALLAHFLRRIPTLRSDPKEMLLGYWILATTAFVVLLSPFVAPRHVLLVVPPTLLLLSARNRSGMARRIEWATLGLGVLICSGLAAGDRWYAEVYRRHPQRILEALPAEATVWFTGHWGWQWYASQAGMRPLSARTGGAEVGDFVVTPQNVDPSALPDGLQLALYDRIEVDRPTGFARWVSAHAGFYSSSRWHLPWTYSEQPIERFEIRRVVAVDAPVSDPLAPLREP